MELSVGMYSAAGKIHMSERIKRHLDEFARDQFIVKLRQPKVRPLSRRVFTAANSFSSLSIKLS